MADLPVLTEVKVQSSQDVRQVLLPIEDMLELSISNNNNYQYLPGDGLRQLHGVVLDVVIHPGVLMEDLGHLHFKRS